MPSALPALTGHPTGDDLHGIGIEIVQADTTPAGCCWSATFNHSRPNSFAGGFTIAERRRKALQLETITLKNNWIKMIQLFPPPNR